MKKVLFVLTATFLFISSGLGQFTYQIISAQSNINYLKSETGGSSSVEQAVEVKVTFRGVEPITNVPLNFVLINPNAYPIVANPAITNIPVGGYYIPKEKIGTSPDTITFTVNIKIDAIPAITINEIFDLQLAGFTALTDPRHRVIIESISTKQAEKDTKEKKKDKMNIGAVSIGHSFDFFGKDNALISYADAFIFKPNSISIGKKATEKKYGFAIKLYQNKSVTVDSLNTAGNLYKFINQTLTNPLQPPVNDSVYLKQEVLNRKTSYKSNNWGMYIRLFKDISYTTNDKTKFYLGVHGEFLRRDILTTYEYKSEKDTVIKIKSNQIPYQGTAPLGKNAIQSEFYVAPYIEFVHLDDEINVRFSVIPMGLNVYRSTVLNNTTFNKAFFMGQFDLIINKINVKLGAECRGLYNVKSQPYWNVFISKSLSWDKLKELVQ
jgi:hypothetical protein